VENLIAYLVEGISVHFPLISYLKALFLLYVEQENVLAESRMMVPDCRKRLEASLSELKGTLVLFHYFFVCLP
jgi:hypothetical protein